MTKPKRVSLAEVHLTTELNIVEGSTLRTGKSAEGKEWSNLKAIAAFPSFSADENGKPVEVEGRLEVSCEVDVKPGRQRCAIAITSYLDRRSGQPKTRIKIIKVLK